MNINLARILRDKISTSDPEKIKEIVEILEEMKKRKNENLAPTYVPNLKSEEFIRQVGSNKHFINLFLAGNGVGKTCTLANIINAICFGVTPHDTTRSRWKLEWGEPPSSFFNYPLFQNFPYAKRGRIISDPTTIKSKIIPELELWFPSNRCKMRYDTRKEGKQYEAMWETDTGFVFDLMTTEQSAKEFESVDLGFIVLDEPIPYEIYKACVARGRKGMIFIWGMTPLKHSAWIKDLIFDKRDGDNIEYVTASTWDNCEDMEGARGMLKRDHIVRQMSQYDTDEALSRIEGKFGHVLGLVHKGYDEKIHVIQPFDIDRRDYCVTMALDTHPQIEDALLWMAIDSRGRKFIVDELWIKGTDEELSAEIKAKENNMRIIDRLIDPSGFNEDKRTTEVSFADRLRLKGLHFRKGSKKLHECIRRTDKAFSFEIKNGQMIRQPEIFIFSTCRRLRKELQNYVWDERKGKANYEKTEKGQPKDKNDHFVECLHRLLIEEYSFRKSFPLRTKLTYSNLRNAI